MQVKVASELITHRFYIENDITGDGILGMDFLKPLGANDLGKSCLQLQNSELPLRYSAKQITVAKVVLKENTVVPANHEVVFPAKIDPETNPGDYEPSTSFSENTSLLVGHVLAVLSELHACMHQ